MECWFSTKKTISRVYPLELIQCKRDILFVVITDGNGSCDGQSVTCLTAFMCLAYISPLNTGLYHRAFIADRPVLPV